MKLKSISNHIHVHTLKHKNVSKLEMNELCTHLTKLFSKL